MTSISTGDRSWPDPGPNPEITPEGKELPKFMTARDAFAAIQFEGFSQGWWSVGNPATKPPAYRFSMTIDNLSYWMGRSCRASFEGLKDSFVKHGDFSGGEAIPHR